MPLHLLFLFLDGVGLGTHDPAVNPFARAGMPNLMALLGGRRLLLGESIQTERATLLALDAVMGVNGLPQSATGQATLLTGQNVPATIGYHYGPKPNPPVAEFLKNGNLFSMLKKNGRKVAFLDAYPPRYFDAIASGMRIYSAIPLAATSAGIPLKTIGDLRAGDGVAADLTAEGWSTHLHLSDIPMISPEEAGSRLASLAQANDFSLFEYWLSDYAGHGQDMEAACALLKTLDRTLGGLFEAWQDQQGLILLTSDHGNLEDLTTRRHTNNPVPGLLVGSAELRQRFVHFAQRSADRRAVDREGKDVYINSIDLTDVTPAILGFLE
jgi:hypothetical protein